MDRALTLRRWLTWLFFLAGLVAVVVAGETNSFLIQYFGLDYPRSLTSKLPVATQQLIAHPGLFTAWTKPAAAVSVICAYLIVRKAQSREAAYHYLSLLALVLYHLALMAVLFFTVVFFLLPRAFAGF